MLDFAHGSSSGSRSFSSDEQACSLAQLVVSSSPCRSFDTCVNRSRTIKRDSLGKKRPTFDRMTVLNGRDIEMVLQGSFEA